MDDHAGVKITVQGGGSGAGVSSAGLGIVDIGAASRDMKSGEESDYPDMVVYPVGGSAVVLIANSAVTGGEVDREHVIAAYTNNDFTGATLATATPITKAYQRSDASGTEDTFADWLDNDTFHADIGGAIGNAGVLAAVKGDAASMGFVDFGFADGEDGVQILGIVDTNRSGTTYLAGDITKKNLKAAIKENNDDKYPTGKVNDIPGLTRPLNYMTNGEPNPMVKAFITYAQSPGATDHFGTCGYFAYTEIV